MSQSAVKPGLTRTATSPTHSAGQRLRFQAGLRAQVPGLFPPTFGHLNNGPAAPSSHLCPSTEALAGDLAASELCDDVPAPAAPLCSCVRGLGPQTRRHYFFFFLKRGSRTGSGSFSGNISVINHTDGNKCAFFFKINNNNNNKNKPDLLLLLMDLYIVFISCSSL